MHQKFCVLDTHLEGIDLVTSSLLQGLFILPNKNEISWNKERSPGFLPISCELPNLNSSERMLPLWHNESKLVLYEVGLSQGTYIIF